MTLTLTLPPGVEGALAEEARRQGTTPEKVVLDDLRQLYDHRSVASTTLIVEDPTLAIFDQWDAEDATSDPEEIVLRIQEWDQTKANLAVGQFDLGERMGLASSPNSKDASLQVKSS